MSSTTSSLPLDYLFNDPRVSVNIGFAYFLVMYAATGTLGAAGAFSLGNFAGLLY